jgi:cysteine desulfuration protein SufE
MPLPPKLAERLEDLSLFPDRAERVEALIALGEEYRHPDDGEVPRTDETRVPGCESEVFVRAKPRRDGTLDYRFAVDNPQGISAMAFARILEEGLSGAPREQVAAVPDDLVYEVFGRELSMGKSMGLMGMVRMAKAEAAKAA